MTIPDLFPMPPSEVLKALAEISSRESLARAESNRELERLRARCTHENTHEVHRSEFGGEYASCWVCGRLCDRREGATKGGGQSVTETVWIVERVESDWSCSCGTVVAICRTEDESKALIAGWPEFKRRNDGRDWSETPYAEFDSDVRDDGKNLTIREFRSDISRANP